MDQIRSLAANGPKLENPLICFDANAIALSFTSTNPSHLDLRESLYSFASHQNIAVLSRYQSPSAHVTVARFKQPLTETEVKSLVHGIKQMNLSIPHHSWTISKAELASGAIWYGQPGTMFQPTVLHPNTAAGLI